MARFTGGWFKSYRQAWDKDLSQNIYLWALWNALLHMATWKETQIIWNGKQRTIPAGSVVFGISELADKWECSRQTIWKWLHYLQGSDRIAVESCTRGTLVSICNWEVYQNTEEDAFTPSLHQVDAKWTPSGHQVALSKKVQSKNKEVRSNLKNNITGIRTEYPIEFEQVWAQYGRKGEKKKSFQYWQSLNLSQEEHEDLKKAILNYSKAKPERQYRKDLERFLQMDWRVWVNPLPEVLSTASGLNGKYHPKIEQSAALHEHNQRVVEEFLAEQKGKES